MDNLIGLDADECTEACHAGDLMSAVLVCGMIAVHKAHAQSNDRLQRQETARKQFDEVLPCAAYFKIVYRCIPESMRDGKVARETKVDEFGSRVPPAVVGGQPRMRPTSWKKSSKVVQGWRAAQHENKCSKLALDLGYGILNELKADLPAEARSKTRANKRKNRPGIRAE